MSFPFHCSRQSLEQLPPTARWFWPAFVVVFAAVGTMTTNCVDPDLWGHYQYGKEALQDGALATTTTWSYAVHGFPWVNHENAAEIATAWVADHFGVPGLTVGKLLLATIIMACAVWTARREKTAWLLIGVIAVLAADNMRFHWQFRPHAFSYAYFAIMLATLEWCFADWNSARTNSGFGRIGTRLGQVARRVGPAPPDAGGGLWGFEWNRFVAPVKPDLHRLRWLWVLPPLLCLWTNTHGGFAAGLAIYCAYLGLRGIEAAWWWRGESVGLLKRLAMMILAGILATCLNPYGPNLHWWMLDTLTAAPPEIGDWGPLPIWSAQATGFWMLMLVLGFAAIKSKRPRDLVHLAIMALVLWQSLKHCRHLCFFAMMAAFWMPAVLQSAVQPFIEDWKKRTANAPPARWVSRLAFAGVTVWLAAIAIELGPRLSRLPVEKNEYPVSAMQFLRDNGLGGRVMVTFNWAQYAIACFAAEQRSTPSQVAIDGRLNTCYPREILDVYLDFVLGEPKPGARLRATQSGVFDPRLALTYADPELFLLDRGQKPAVRMIEADPNWVLLYQDSLSQLWGRRDRYDDPESEQYLSPGRRMIGETLQIGSEQWPALPNARRIASRAESPAG